MIPRRAVRPNWLRQQRIRRDMAMFRLDALTTEYNRVKAEGGDVTRLAEAIKAESVYLGHSLDADKP